MKQFNFLLCIGIVICIGIATCYFYICRKEGFATTDATTNNESSSAIADAINLSTPLVQKSHSIVGNHQALVFWAGQEDDNHPINYYIIQYYEVTGDTRVIHSKLVPKKYKRNTKEYSVLVNGLKNDVQYLIQVVGVNDLGLGKLEEGAIVVPLAGTTLFE